MSDCEQDSDGVSDEMRDSVLDLHRRINRAVRREMNYAEALGMKQNLVIAVAGAAATNFLAGSTCSESEQLADEMRGRLVQVTVEFMERAKAIRLRRQLQEAANRSAEQ